MLYLGRMKEETKLWVDQAEDDYKTARAMLRTHRWGYTCFCSQQALEKIFKAAIIEFVNKRPPKIHNLVDLAEKATLKFDKSDLNKFAEMTQHYYRIRYPDLNKKIYANNLVAKEVFTLMEEKYLWVLKKLNQ
jgi:HEPN domain-containing protein